MSPTRHGYALITGASSGIGEPVCIPGLDDPAGFERIGEAERAVLGAANRPLLAGRYWPA